MHRKYTLPVFTHITVEDVRISLLWRDGKPKKFDGVV
jgi:hypothetical protein